jgi:hypothetical protein
VNILDESFEFERKFLVGERSIVVGVDPDLIIQSYLTIREGYVVRVRLHVDADGQFLPDVTNENLDAVWWSYVANGEWVVRRGVLTVKTPGVSGIRFESELELPPEVALHFCRLSDNVIIKLRYPIIWGEDLWVIDIFCGQNSPLMLAECERDEPVDELDVPSFCGREVTGDFRYSNECLAAFPFGTWGVQ